MSKFLALIAKLLFCDIRDLGNVILHISVGAVNGLICLNLGWLGLIIGLGFITYELDQRKQLHDKSYPSIQGWLYGLCIVGLVVFLIGLWTKTSS